MLTVTEAKKKKKTCCSHCNHNLWVAAIKIYANTWSAVVNWAQSDSKSVDPLCPELWRSFETNGNKFSPTPHENGTCLTTLLIRTPCTPLWNIQSVATLFVRAEDKTLMSMHYSFLLCIDKKGVENQFASACSKETVWQKWCLLIRWCYRYEWCLPHYW